MAYADIAGVSPEHAEVVPGPAGSSEKVRSMLMRASGDITVVLKDGSIEEYSAQTATRSGAVSTLENANLSEISIDALAQALLSDRFTARQAALQELERRAPGTLQLGRLNKEQLEVVTALHKVGHAAAAADMLVASGLATVTNNALRWEFPELVPPETPDGPRMLAATVGGSTYTLSEGKNGGTRLLIKSPGSKHAWQTTSLQRPTGDSPRVQAPSLTSSLLGVNSPEDLNSNDILPNENNDPATRAHNERIAAKFGATYIEWRTGENALGGSKSSIVAFFKESPAEIAAALYGVSTTARVRQDGTIERVWTSRDSALRVDSISNVAELTAGEIRSLVEGSTVYQSRTDALRAACMALPEDSPLFGARLTPGMAAAKVASSLSEAPILNNEVFSKAISEMAASVFYKVSNKSWLETQENQAQQAFWDAQHSEPVLEKPSPREAYVARYNPRGDAGVLASGRGPGAIVVDHRGRPYHDRSSNGSTTVSDRDVVFNSSGRPESYDHPTVIDLQPGDAERIEFGHIRGLFESSLESRGPVRFLASDEIAEAAWQKASSIAERAGVGLAIPADRALTLEYARSAYNLPKSTSYRDLAFGVSLGESAKPARYSATPRTIMYDNREVIVIDSTDVPGGELIEGTYVKYGETQRVIFLADHPVYDPDDRVSQ